MNIANIYRNLKKILDDSNVALLNKGLNKINNLNAIPDEVEKLGNINRLPYFLQSKAITLTENDLMGANTIEESFLLYKQNIKSAIIPDSVTTIGYAAFSSCSSLKSVTIPDSVTTIGNYAFRGTNVGNIYIYSTTPPLIHLSDTILSSTTIHVPIGSGNTYKTATNWSYHANRIVEDIVIE